MGFKGNPLAAGRTSKQVTTSTVRGPVGKDRPSIGKTQGVSAKFNAGAITGVQSLPTRAPNRPAQQKQSVISPTVKTGHIQGASGVPSRKGEVRSQWQS